jgi:hypothetical protein
MLKADLFECASRRGFERCRDDYHRAASVAQIRSQPANAEPAAPTSGSAREKIVRRREMDLPISPSSAMLHGYHNQWTQFESRPVNRAERFSK